MVLYFKNDKKIFFPNFSNVCIYYKYINYRLIVTNFVLVAIKKKKNNNPRSVLVANNMRRVQNPIETNRFAAMKYTHRLVTIAIEFG